MGRILLAIGAIIVVCALYFGFKSYTPPIWGAGSIAELREVELNGDRQTILVRGRDRTAPLILFLHGGPGMPAMYLAHAFQRPLEKDFVIVHWDQRGAGKSYRPDTDPDLMRTSQLIADAEALVNILQTEFPGQPIYLVGHSHGSYLGAILASLHPDWFAAYIGVGQVADSAREVAMQDAFLRPRLEEFGYAADAEMTEGLREELLFKTGSEIHGETSFAPLVIAGVLAPEYSFADVMNVAKGSSFSSAHMKRDVIDGPLMDEVAAFDLPVYIIMGEADMVTPVALAGEYYERIEAPRKEFVIIEETAHFPFFEAPARFRDELLRITAATQQ